MDASLANVAGLQDTAIKSGTSEIERFLATANAPDLGGSKTTA